MTLPQIPALSPTAKAYIGAVVTFLTALIAADTLDARAILVAILASVGGGGAVYAVPNSNYPQRAKPRTRGIIGIPLPVLDPEGKPIMEPPPPQDP